MTVTSMLRTLRERWPLLVAGVLVGLLAAGAVAVLTPRSYAATTSMYISASDSASPQAAYQGSLLSQQRVTSYAGLMGSERVLGPVAAELTPGRAGTDLADAVAVSTATDSTIMSITVEDGDPARAAALADAVGARFTTVVGELERPRVPDAPPAVTVSVIDPAAVPTTPVSPQVAVDLVVGLVVGLVGGAALALVRGSLDTTLRDAAELARVSHAVTLGVLPVATAPAEDAGYGEAVRRVRTNLVFADVDRPPKLITVTSAVPAEGKTTLVCALAAAMAGTGRVALVEGDLRRPVIAARLGLVGDVGLTDVLARRTGLGHAVQRWHGVDVLVCGTVPPDPGELLSSGQMHEVMARLRADYDVVLVDAPPLLPVADAGVLARRSDGTVLVGRAGRTTRSQVEGAVQALEAVGARVLGSVLSYAPARKDDPAGYGYGGYGAAPVTAVRANPPSPSRPPTPDAVGTPDAVDADAATRALVQVSPRPRRSA